MLNAYYGILVVLILFELIFCEENHYCVDDGDSPGMFIEDFKDKDSEYIGQNSIYFDNSTEQLHLTQHNSTWRIVDSVRSKTHLRVYVVDERWETFPDNHNSARKDVIKILKEGKLFFISVRITNNSSNFSSLKPKQWHHFKVKDSKICDYNDTIINQNVTQFYEEISKKDILKLHEYKYLYTNESKTETIYTNTKNCVLISEGCFSMHLAMCRGCNITIQLNSNRGTINKEFSGTGGWKKEQFPLENFDTCFNISTSQLEHGIGETFWAIGEVIYLSSNLSCKENKRYLRIANHTSDYICENAVNEKINIASSLADNRKKYCDPYTMSSNDYLYLFTVLPVVLITSLIACCSICLIRKTKFKRQFKSEDIPSNKIDKMQEITLLNFTEDQNDYQIIYNDGWKKVCRKDYLQYVKLAFEPSCTHLDIQFSNIPTGYLKDNKKSLKKKNILKNQDHSILPYDVNRVKLNNKKDYINASYVQISDNEKEYIVTQNPLENTTADFWDMIWQENVNHIIMITSPNEKFVYYWPKLKGDLIYFDDIRVSLKEIWNDKFYIHRRLQVQRNGKSRQIDQLHYNLWEIDNDLSLTSRTCKEFMNHLLKIPHHVAPVVVHSKNGTGRCGTIVLCDAVLRALPITDKIDLYGFTVKLRNVRANMVSDLEQFKLAHLIVRDMVS